MTNERKGGLTRRELMAATAATGAAMAFGVRPAFADDSLNIGFISPRTGPLAGFGQTDGYVLDVARKALADGIELAGKKYSVEILDQDTQSDPSRAGQLAKDLINNQAIDLMLAVSTPETINPVADACEAAGVPCLSTVMPWEAWYFGRGAKPGEPSPFKWTYHFGFGVEEFFNAYASQWKLIETNKKVGGRGFPGAGSSYKADGCIRYDLQLKRVYRRTRGAGIVKGHVFEAN